MFPYNATTTQNYQTTGNGTTTILDLAEPANLLYAEIEKTQSAGEIKIYADNVLISHLDGTEKQVFFKIPFKKLELVRDSVNGDSFASFTYAPATTTAELAPVFTYGDIVLSVFGTLIVAILLYRAIND